MDTAELIELASPHCHEGGVPVRRVQTRWHRDQDLHWRRGPFFIVCAPATVCRSSRSV